jgi:hypothetical protein
MDEYSNDGEDDAKNAWFSLYFVFVVVVFFMAPCFVSEHEKREESFDKFLRSDSNDDSRA